jgi:hypothetical protein
MLISGYLILQINHLNYRGVDRRKIEPLFDSEIDKTITNFNHIWELFPYGWKREAYKLFEENSIRYSNIQLIKAKEIAKKIKLMIPETEGCFEINKVYIYMPNEYIDISKDNLLEFLGYDVAYLGGDYYSAIKNGLINNPSKELLAKYFTCLNANYLFEDEKLISDYIADFKRITLSEQDSEFYVYSLANSDN